MDCQRGFTACLYKSVWERGQASWLIFGDDCSLRPRQQTGLLVISTRFRVHDDEKDQRGGEPSRYSPSPILSGHRNMVAIELDSLSLWVG